MRNALLPSLLGPAVLLAATMAHGQAATPEDHPGYPLAQAIAAEGCVLHESDVNDLLDRAGLSNAQFPQMAVPLMQTGFLRPSGDGTLTLVNWGLCTGDVPTEDEDLADIPEEGTATE